MRFGAGLCFRQKRQTASADVGPEDRLATARNVHYDFQIPFVCLKTCISAFLPHTDGMLTRQSRSQAD